MGKLTIIERLEKLRDEIYEQDLASTFIKLDEIIKDLDKITEVSGEADRTLQNEYIEYWKSYKD